MDIYKAVLNTINKYHMTEQGMHVVAAVSGGADSICLLWVLKELSRELGITLEAFHLHHGIRGEEADRDADFVEDVCSRWNIPVTIRYADVRKYGSEKGLSLEEAGRILRYQALDELAAAAGERTGKKTVAAAAHHMGDSAETILHNLFRGTGLKGLRGIPPVRGGIIRPLIDLSRKEIEDFLLDQGISWCEDSTNKDNEYTRNKIRNVILPLAKSEINKEAEAHIIQAGNMIALADDYLEKTAGKLWEQYGEPCLDKKVSFPVDIMRQQEKIIRFYLIRKMAEIAGGTIKDITFRHVESAEKLLWGQTGKQADLPGNIRAYREYEKLYVEKKNICTKKQDLSKDPCIKDNLGERMNLEIFSYKKGSKIPKNQYTKWFDYDRMENMPCLRYRQPGDFITLAGGGRKSIKSFMIDEKIPREKRGDIPLLADGSHIIWVVGYRISEYYKITEDTKTVLEARFAEGGENGGKDTSFIK